MQGHSHMVVGASAALVVNAVYPFTHPAMSLAFGVVLLANVIGSLGPDIDADESRIRHMTGTARSDGCMGKIVSVLMPKHRGWIHSPVLAAALVGLAWWIGWAWLVAFAIGWAGHILADNLMGFLHIKNQSLAELLLVVAAGVLAWRAW